MAIEVDPVAEGYLLRATPPESGFAVQTIGPVAREQVLRHLVSVGVHPRDAAEYMENADRVFRAGMSEDVRSVREIQRRMDPGCHSDEDVRKIASELLDSDSPLDKSGLINMLRHEGLTPHDLPVAKSAIREFVHQSRDGSAVIAALRVASRRFAESYDELARRFVVGEEWDRDGNVQGWAMTFAARLIRENRSRALLDDLRLIATSNLNPVATRNATLALAGIVGVDVPPDVLQGHNPRWVVD